MVLVVRLIRPIVLVRFGSISAYIFGTFIFDTEFYLREKCYKNINSIDYFFYNYKYKNFENSTNIQWDKMVRRKIKVHPFVSKLYHANKIIPGGKPHLIKMAVENSKSRDLYGILSKTTPKLIFSKVENLEGNSFLESLGIKSQDKFICLNVRDSKYKQIYQNWKKDWSYHDQRNSLISTYENAAIDLADKGYWVFRMGKVVKDPFKIDHDRVIDYANKNYRCDFLDIWLAANCSFFISTGTGLDNVANVFRKPLIFVNYLGPISYMITWNYSITFPKRLIWKKNQIMLTLTEQLNHNYTKSYDYFNAGIEIIDLTPDEINDAISEMEMRLNGTWEETENDKKRQDHFWKIFKSNKNYKKLHGTIHPETRIGSSFLKNNPKFLN